MNPVLRRNEAIRAARVFFTENNLLEVNTRRIVLSPALEPYIDALKVSGTHTPAPLYLATSAEFAQKKIFAAEMAAHSDARGIYEIGPVFRDDRPGKNHAPEFTMIEWYQKNSTLAEILRDAAALIARIAQLCGATRPEGALEILDLRELFAQSGCVCDFSDEDAVISKYLSVHNKLPHHLNETDAAIACFNLLFDEYALPALKAKTHPVAVAGYPEYLAALAFCNDGVAQRAEIFYRGLELANGYREEYRPEIARARWEKYNGIRRLRGADEHMIDEALLAALPAMEGVCGIAVGLERVLMSFSSTANISDFT